MQQTTTTTHGHNNFVSHLLCVIGRQVEALKDSGVPGRPQPKPDYRHAASHACRICHNQTPEFRRQHLQPRHRTAEAEKASNIHETCETGVPSPVG